MMQKTFLRHFSDPIIAICDKNLIFYEILMQASKFKKNVKI